MKLKRAFNQIPERLYRGDDDRTGIRKLKSTIHHNQYQTNLINGGEGRIIFETPIIKLINVHVGIGWNKTHFLSFSEDLLTAYKYGSGNLLLSEIELEDRYEEYLEDDEKWAFALITLQTDNIDWKILDKGVYEGFYEPTLRLFANSCYRVVLLDVKTVLSEWKNFDTSYARSYSNAVRDKEWLLLPATIINLNGGIQEYSAILDGRSISSKKLVWSK